jgi:radical SAM superfamily enzyme YgiQ (UPF0313 family)
METLTPINVAFYAPMVEQDKNPRAKYDGRISVNPTPYYLHGYFRTNFPEYAHLVKWKSSILRPLSDEDLVTYLVTHDIDILCSSLYPWTKRHVLSMFVNIKELYAKHTNKPLKIILGGPSVDADKSDWHGEYPFVDQFVVGQGEKAWAELIFDHWGIKPITVDSANIVHLLKKKTDTIPSEKSYRYEFLRNDIHYSPYQVCEDMVQELIADEEGRTDHLMWPYETQRGCPYTCSFCDWNGGESNKTQKRKNVDFLKDIDMMARNKMYNLYLSDANFGMWDVDLEITERMVMHSKNGHPFKIPIYNMAKNLNDTAKKILWTIIENDLWKDWIKISAQDPNIEVLKTINRPGGWDDWRDFGLAIYKEFSVRKGINKIWIEFITGLPGQTTKTWIDSLDEIYSNGFLPRTFAFMLLPNAPIGYDQEMRTKYKIKNDLTYNVLEYISTGETIQDIINNPENIMYEQVIASHTYDEHDLVFMSASDQLYRLMLSRMAWPGYGFLDVNWKHLKPILAKLIETEDFKYVIDKRHENFMKYRVNALESSTGKVLLLGDDMMSIIARNFHIIDESFKETNIPEEIKVRLLSVWDTFKHATTWLDR